MHFTQDVSVHIPAGKLTILIGSRNVDAEINSLFRLIWGGHDLDRDDETVILQKGHVKIHGLDMRDWKLNALRDCTVLMTDNEKHMPLNLGLV